MGAYELSLLTLIGINALLALSLNLITGLCGQPSLGHAAFFGVGAYAAALAGKGGASLPTALGTAATLAGAAGLLVGLTSLRVREDFLAITTMGAGFLFLGIVRQQAALGGELGISQIPAPAPRGAGFLLLVLGSVAALAASSLYLQRSWMGFALDAIADDEDTALTLGIDAARYKLVAFAVGTAVAGLAGGFYAYYARIVVPGAFGFTVSITVLAMVVVGGIGSTMGVLVGAVVLTLLPEIFRFINDYKLLVYGGLLLVTMRVSPGGLAGLGRALARRLRARGLPAA